jgi:hypothetical protein
MEQKNRKGGKEGKRERRGKEEEGEGKKKRRRERRGGFNNQTTHKKNTKKIKSAIWERKGRTKHANKKTASLLFEKRETGLANLQIFLPIV